MALACRPLSSTSSSQDRKVCARCSPSHIHLPPAYALSSCRPSLSPESRSLVTSVFAQASHRRSAGKGC
eukprot:40416-Eustigmatos_ZCMA.PRE.1